MTIISLDLVVSRCSPSLLLKVLFTVNSQVLTLSAAS